MLSPRRDEIHEVGKNLKMKIAKEDIDELADKLAEKNCQSIEKVKFKKPKKEIYKFEVYVLKSREMPPRDDITLYFIIQDGKVIGDVDGLLEFLKKKYDVVHFGVISKLHGKRC